MKLNATNKSTLKGIAVIIILIIVIAFISGPPPKMSMYQPRDLTIVSKSDKSIFTLPGNKECKTGYYSNSTGGVCGAQEIVKDHGDFEISDGIGGNLI